MWNLFPAGSDSPNQALNAVHAAGEHAEKEPNDDEDYSGQRMGSYNEIWEYGSVVDCRMIFVVNWLMDYAFIAVHISLHAHLSAGAQDEFFRILRSPQPTSN